MSLVVHRSDGTRWVCATVVTIDGGGGGAPRAAASLAGQRAAIGCAIALIAFVALVGARGAARLGEGARRDVVREFVAREVSMQADLHTCVRRQRTAPPPRLTLARGCVAAIYEQRAPRRCVLATSRARNDIGWWRRGTTWRQVPSDVAAAERDPSETLRRWWSQP